MEFIKNPQIIGAMIAFSGVIVGAIATGIITLLSDIIKFKRDEKTYYKRKREETYVAITQIIYKLCGSAGKYVKDINTELFYNQLMNILVNIELYSSKKIYTYFRKNIMKKMAAQNNYDLSHEELDTLIKLIRDDLKIED